METVKVSGRYQISLPSRARRELDIEAGDRLMVVVQDGMLILLPQPRDYVEAMAGLHNEIWKGIDTTTYLNEERAIWTASDED
ncbi:MAG: AbrB/MazE/SpoVT family DNA-binding domain-containing protein [Anaerolineae bacterium]|nr:AbrB/MazE/SpoVT family DNA-binding domain-containing protein [Anaerolineae bacterium]HNS40380.1 AbrB/MazE/SpoVT family DNA-binding domain-containing protein [Promineifilum sp.]